MHRILISLLLTTGPALAECNDTLIEFTSWSIKAVDAQNNEVTTTFKSNAAKPIRMLDASAGYKDALGKTVGTFSLDRDVAIAPGDSYTEVKTWGPYTFERLLKLKPEEVSTFACTRAVLYDDGTKEEFK